jgi:hypothetical protein
MLAVAEGKKPGRRRKKKKKKKKLLLLLLLLLLLEKKKKKKKRLLGWTRKKKRLVTPRAMLPARMSGVWRLLQGGLAQCRPALYRLLAPSVAGTCGVLAQWLRQPSLG